MKRIKSIIAITLAGSVLTVTARPAQSNPAMLAAPAVCAGTAGLGCIFLGVAVIGGIGYAVWQAQDTGKQHYVKIEDPEEEAAAMGNNAQNGRIIKARTASQAHTRCAKFADGRRVASPLNLGNGRWRCRYY